MVRRVVDLIAALSGRVWRLIATPPRIGPFKEGAFASPLHDERPAAWLGMALGVAFSVCFVTGVLSDQIQNPLPFFTWVPRPAGLYRVTQGLHVATGLAAVPLLLVKLWVVSPSLWQWPTVRSARHLLERLSILPLVAGALFLLATGIANIAYWYPFGFAFLTGHYWAAWITIGALVVHIGAKAGIAGRVVRTRRAAQPAPVGATEGGLTRRGLIGLAAATSGVVVAAVIGDTVTSLGRLSVLAPRESDVGPQGFPVNKTAAGAGVVAQATDPGWRLRVGGAVARPMELTLAQLRALPQTEAVLPIACVEGWSTSQRWRGVAVRDLLATAGAAVDRDVVVESLQQQNSPYRATTLSPGFAADPDTLLALDVGGEPLHLDHGFPVRLIAPNNPGVLQTKWVTQVTVA